jgi:hypothetical protein
MIGDWIVRGERFALRGGLPDKWGRFKHFNILSMDKSNGRATTPYTRIDSCREALRTTQGACPCSLPQKTPRDQEKATTCSATKRVSSGLKNILE